jgi:hypothetical protein
MQQSKMALALSTLCSALLISACEPKRIVTALPMPPERIDCEAATGKRPTLPPEYRIDWAKVASVGQAQAEHERFVSVIRGREGIVSNYVLELEGMLFQCSNDAAWVREWQAGTR